MGEAGKKRPFQLKLLKRQRCEPASEQPRKPFQLWPPLCAAVTGCRQPSSGTGRGTSSRNSKLGSWQQSFHYFAQSTGNPEFVPDTHTHTQMSAEGHAPVYRYALDPFRPCFRPLGGQADMSWSQGQIQGPARRGHRPRPPDRQLPSRDRAAGSGRTRAKNEDVSHYGSCVPGQGRLWLTRGTEQAAGDNLILLFGQWGGASTDQAPDPGPAEDTGPQSRRCAASGLERKTCLTGAHALRNSSTRSCQELLMKKQLFALLSESSRGSFQMLTNV